MLEGLEDNEKTIWSYTLRICKTTLQSPDPCILQPKRIKKRYNEIFEILSPKTLYNF